MRSWQGYERPKMLAILPGSNLHRPKSQPYSPVGDAVAVGYLVSVGDKVCTVVGYGVVAEPGDALGASSDPSEVGRSDGTPEGEYVESSPDEKLVGRLDGAPDGPRDGKSVVGAGESNWH